MFPLFRAFLISWLLLAPNFFLAVFAAEQKSEGSGLSIPGLGQEAAAAGDPVSIEQAQLEQFLDLANHDKISDLQSLMKALNDSGKLKGNWGDLKSFFRLLNTNLPSAKNVIEEKIRELKTRNPASSISEPSPSEGERKRKRSSSQSARQEGETSANLSNMLQRGTPSASGSSSSSFIPQNPSQKGATLENVSNIPSYPVHASSISGPSGESSSSTFSQSSSQEGAIDIQQLSQKLANASEQEQLEYFLAWAKQGKTSELAQLMTSLQNFDAQNYKSALKGVENLPRFLNLLKTNLADAQAFLRTKIEALEEARSPYALTSNPNLEERWRWWQNFKVKVGDSDEIFDFSELHKYLSKTMKSVQVLLNGDDANILVPYISIIYKNNQGQTNKMEGFIKWISSKDTNAIFISGREDFDKSLLYDNFKLIKGGALGLDPAVIRKDLDFFYSQSEDHKLSRYKTFFLDKLKRGSNKDIGTSFYHSEQWLIHYLSGGYIGRFKQYGRLCFVIEEILKSINDLKKINAIILHLGSKKDICDVCSPTLAIFLEQLNSQKGQTQIKATLNEHTNSAFTVGETRFFIIASSFDSRLGSRFRSHPTLPQGSDIHGDRRGAFGRDRHLDDPNTPIEIRGGLPYFYVQVPVDENGEPVKLDK